MSRATLLAVIGASAALLAPAAALSSDGTLKAAIGTSLQPLFGQVAVLTKRIQTVVAPGTSAATRKRFAPTAIASGKSLASFGAKGLALLTAQKPSTAAGVKAKAVCVKLFTGVKSGGTQLVAWGKAAAGGTVTAAATKKLAAFANALVPAGLGCQSAYGSLK